MTPVWCAATDVKAGTPTAESVSCTTTDPNPEASSEQGSLHLIPAANAQVMSAASDAPPGVLAPAQLSYTKFTDQDVLGSFLAEHYKIRPKRELPSCEVCHR